MCDKLAADSLLMTTPTHFLLLLFLLGLFSLRPSAQTPSPTPTPDDDDPVTSTERAEIRRFSKDLVSHLEKTQDIRPLRRRYFAKDFESFVYQMFFSTDSLMGVGEITGRLQRSEKKRLATAGTNLIYFCGKLFVSDEGGSDEFSGMLPPDLAKRFDTFIDGLGRENKYTTRKAALAILYRMESLMHRLSLQFRAHPFDSYAGYRHGLKKRLAHEDYDFRIMNVQPDEDDDDGESLQLKLWAKDHDPAARFYAVTTAYGYALFIVKTHGRYKAIFLMPYPISS